MTENIPDSYKTRLSRQGFELVEILGSGTSGKTIKAFQESLNRYVAVKFFDNTISRRDLAQKKRFLREARLLADLQHPSIPFVLTCGNVENAGEQIPYFVMQYISGSTLDNYINNHAPVSSEKAIHVANQMLDTLKYIHAKGVIHRDIKPSNIIMSQSGHCFLIDFSIGFKPETDPGLTRVTRTGYGLGTLRYSAPEQEKDAKNATPASDIYSFSIVLCELLTGKPDILSFDASALPHAELLKKIIGRGCTYDQSERYQNADEYMRELSQLTNIPINFRNVPADAICRNTSCRDADWSPNGYYRGPKFISETLDPYCTTCGSKHLFQCESCGKPTSLTRYCGGCGEEQFQIPECERCGSYLKRIDIDADTSKSGCSKCRSGIEETNVQSGPPDEDIPF